MKSATDAANSEGNDAKKTLIAGGGNQGFYRMTGQTLAVDALDSILFPAKAASCDNLLWSLLLMNQTSGESG
jgi:hypothetical protein